MINLENSPKIPSLPCLTGENSQSRDVYLPILEVISWL
jgi:hypothetical protein